MTAKSRVSRERKDMSLSFGWTNLQALLRDELRGLITIQASDRAWQMPVAAALASGLPLVIGAYLDRMNWGMVSSLGGLVFLYLPATPLYHRMVMLMACAFALVGCYTLGIMSHFVPVLMMPALVFTTILVAMVTRFYALSPPGSLVFMVAASIGAYSSVDTIEQLPMMVGLIAMGALLACLIGFFYSLYMLRRHDPRPVAPLPVPTFDFVVVDSVVIGVFVGISLVIAQALNLERAYWVPISCVAVLQGASLRAVWDRQLHRIIGTGLGLMLAWGLLLLPMNNWIMALTMMVLTFVIESTVVRHYAVAATFMTPLTIMLAEAATQGRPIAPTVLIEARFYDTVLGCLVGLAGGVCIHSPRFREVVGGALKRLIPVRTQP
jgi:uncharacterized membrane protein YccC